IETKRHCRIEVSARNRTEGIGARCDGQAHRQRHAQKSYAKIWKRRVEYSAADAAKKQPKCAQELRGQFALEVHVTPPSVAHHGGLAVAWALSGLVRPLLAAAYAKRADGVPPRLVWLRSWGGVGTL